MPKPKVSKSLPVTRDADHLADLVAILARDPADPRAGETEAECLRTLGAAAARGDDAAIAHALEAVRRGGARDVREFKFQLEQALELRELADSDGEERTALLIGIPVLTACPAEFPHGQLTTALTGDLVRAMTDEDLFNTGSHVGVLDYLYSFAELSEMPPSAVWQLAHAALPALTTGSATGTLGRRRPKGATCGALKQQGLQLYFLVLAVAEDDDSLLLTDTHPEYKERCARWQERIRNLLTEHLCLKPADVVLVRPPAVLFDALREGLASLRYLRLTTALRDVLMDATGDPEQIEVLGAAYYELQSQSLSCLRFVLRDTATGKRLGKFEVELASLNGMSDSLLDVIHQVFDDVGITRIAWAAPLLNEVCPDCDEVHLPDGELAHAVPATEEDGEATPPTVH